MKQKIFNPKIDFPELFDRVQSGDYFADSKSFVDAFCLYDPELITSEYQRNKSLPTFCLDEFISKYFKESVSSSSDYKTQAEDISDHIHKLWKYLTREDADEQLISSRIPLPFRYVVPGGRFNEIYYWDSYFTMLGLIESGEKQLALDMYRNFLWLIDEFGFIPNGNRSYYLSRSQPPFFSLMTELMIENHLIGVNQKILEVLKREYDFWMGKSIEFWFSGKSIKAARYYDAQRYPREESYKEDLRVFMEAQSVEIYSHLRSACESGWDFSSRWLRDKKSLSSIMAANILPVDLNCLIWNLEKLIGFVSETLAFDDLSSEFKAAARLRKDFITSAFYHKDLQWFDDLDINGKFMNNLSLAGIFPMFFGLADDEQADYCQCRLSKEFLKSGGLVTSLVDSGQQWDAPNGWAPLQYVAVQALLKYGYDDLAIDVMARWNKTVETEFTISRKVMEKYNVINPEIKGGGGEYPNQDGFGWTNAVYLIFRNRLNQLNNLKWQQPGNGEKNR